ncbi:hypothetical protein J5289_21665 [Rhizobium sp. B230/85]|nr:hypothetical protein [Rhizobium sp. B209b/85]MBO9186805.1 hypothetical protein [Rhizobium sp. E27B/91]QXZ99096.1 hypothetical protein J5289_21665 [Rhizobium sp. B230/85]
MSAPMLAIAEELSTTHRRHLNNYQISIVARQHGLTRDEARSAAIMADRIRRHRQAEEQRNCYQVELVPVDAPIVLKSEGKASSPRSNKVSQRHA